MPPLRGTDGRGVRRNVSESLRITIVGGGMAGPLLACLLADGGHDVHMLERRSDPRLGDHGGGRSINLALSVRGLEALERIGLREQVLQAVVPMQARLVHDERGRLVRQPYSRIPGEAINSVSRGGLNGPASMSPEGAPPAPGWEQGWMRPG